MVKPYKLARTVTTETGRVFRVVVMAEDSYSADEKASKELEGRSVWSMDQYPATADLPLGITELTPMQDVTTLIQTLAGELDADESHSAALAYQAFELAAPVLDYEEAAREAGWSPDPQSPDFVIVKEGAVGCFGDGRWQTACEQENIEPHEREPVAFYAITAEQADAMPEERIDRDFAGMIVWAKFNG